MKKKKIWPEFRENDGGRSNHPSLVVSECKSHIMVANWPTHKQSDTTLGHGQTPRATLGFWLMLWTETFRLSPVSVDGRHWLGRMGEDSVTAFDPRARRMEIIMKDSSAMVNSVTNCSALLPSPLLVGPGEVGILNLPCEGFFYKEG